MGEEIGHGLLLWRVCMGHSGLILGEESDVVAFVV